MQIKPFALERYFAQYEFSARYLLSSSDCEALTQRELLALADEETAALWENLALGYTESSGHPLLRQAVAETYDGLEADDVRIAVPEEAIFLFMHALLQSGDHVVCTFPGYQSLYEVAESIGCRVSFWEPEEERGWRFDPGRLAELLQPGTRLVVVNFPHNPTGCLPSPDDFQAIVDLTRRQGAYLLSDEMYRLLEMAPNTPLPAACTLYERAVSLSGLSKAFGLPGLRLGWLATSDRPLLARVTALKDYTTICHSAPSEILGLMAIRARESILADQRARASRNLAVLEAFFERYQQLFRWVRPGGGSICFPRLTAAPDAHAFCEELVQETGIMLVPSTIFDFGRRHVRIGFGRQNLPEVLARFGAYLDRRFPQATSA
jgi:aspartate/methionine/tyrosine aminotransferase